MVVDHLEVNLVAEFWLGVDLAVVPALVSVAGIADLKGIRPLYKKISNNLVADLVP